MKTRPYIPTRAVQNQTQFTAIKYAVSRAGNWRKRGKRATISITMLHPSADVPTEAITAS